MIEKYKKIPGVFRNVIERVIKKKEKGEYFSNTLRKIYKEVYNINIGIGSYGCFNINQFPEGTTIGNYCSIAPRVYFLYSNHPMTNVSTHPIFYNKLLGYVGKDKIERVKLTVENDVWIGAGTIITRGCTKIGNGAVIGAGSIVTHDVPPYAIVAGNPARTIRFRFDSKTIKIIEETKWFELNPEELKEYIPYANDVHKFCKLVTDYNKGKQNERIIK